MPKSRIVKQARQRISAAGEGLRAALHAVDNRQHAGDLQPERLGPLDRQQRRAARGDHVLDDHRRFAGLNRALDEIGWCRALWTPCGP